MNEADSNSESVKRLAHVQKTLARRVSDLVSAARRVRTGADTEGTHDLRVSARGLDAMLRTWDCLFRPRLLKSAIRALRQVRRGLGEAREFQVHISTLEQRLALHGEPAVRLLRRLRGELDRSTARAAEELRPKRLRRLLERIESATSGLESKLLEHPDAFARARARVQEAGAVAHVALQFACTQEGDWFLHEARIATKKWRYTIECVQDMVPLREAKLLGSLREIQTAFGTFQDRATLLDAIEKFGRKVDRPGLQALMTELESEKQVAIREARALATALIAKLPAMLAPARPRIRPVKPIGPIAPAVETPAASERWEHMAQWLLGKSAADPAAGSR